MKRFHFIIFQLFTQIFALHIHVKAAAAHLSQSRGLLMDQYHQAQFKNWKI